MGGVRVSHVGESYALVDASGERWPATPISRTWRVGLEPKHEDADLGTLIDELLERLKPEAAERV